MKFAHLFSVIAVLIVHAWASPDDAENSGVAHTNKREPVVDSAENTTVSDMQMAGSCVNKGLTGRPIGDCHPGDSKGFRSAHNCKNAGGKYYLCVTPPTTVNCGPIRNFVGYENGECFL